MRLSQHTVAEITSRAVTELTHAQTETNTANVTPDTMKPKTPWQTVFAKFGMSQSQFADVLNRHRSKISRALSDEKGLINGADQELIISVSKSLGITICADDLIPSFDGGDDD